MRYLAELSPIWWVYGSCCHIQVYAGGDGDTLLISCATTVSPRPCTRRRSTAPSSLRRRAWCTRTRRRRLVSPIGRSRCRCPYINNSYNFLRITVNSRLFAFGLWGHNDGEKFSFPIVKRTGDFSFPSIREFALQYGMKAISNIGFRRYVK